MNTSEGDGGACPRSLAPGRSLGLQFFPTLGETTQIAIASFAVLFLVSFVNIGSEPIAFADEFTYNFFSRLISPSQSDLGGFLFLYFYRLTSACGEGFLDCVRLFNALFLSLTLPLIYIVGRQFTSHRMAFWIAILGVFAPRASYALYFMPDMAYGFFFWIFASYIVLTRDDSSTRFTVASGLILAVMALVKVHAVFLVAAMVVFFVILLVFQRFEFKSAARAILEFLASFSLFRLLGGYAAVSNLPATFLPHYLIRVFFAGLPRRSRRYALSSVPKESV